MSTPDAGISSPGADRREFVRAFVEHTRARPGADRRPARPHVIVMVATASAAAAVLAGVVLQVLRPVPLAQALAPAPVVTGLPFVAIGGWDCATGADRGFTASGRNADWITVSHGGWAQDGCHGTFVAIPFSGKAAENSGQLAQWWFTPGPKVTECAIEVYVPRGDRPQEASATAARFDVLAGQSGGAFAMFTVDQTANAGHWVPAGTFPVTGGTIAVQLDNRGVPASADARLAVAQVRVNCPTVS